MADYLGDFVRFSAREGGKRGTFYKAVPTVSPWFGREQPPKITGKNQDREDVHRFRGFQPSRTAQGLL
jgi:hypothetical protein